MNTKKEILESDLLLMYKHQIYFNTLIELFYSDTKDIIYSFKFLSGSTFREICDVKRYNNTMLFQYKGCIMARIDFETHLSDKRKILFNSKEK